MIWPILVKTAVLKKNTLQVRFTTVEDATFIIHTEPVLEGPSLGGQQVLQLPCPGGAEATRCDTQTRNLILFLNACGHMRRELSPPDLFHASFRYKIAELR